MCTYFHYQGRHAIMHVALFGWAAANVLFDESPLHLACI